MINQWKKQIEKYSMLECGDKVLIGLSGGADSVCLTRLLVLLREEYNLSLGAVCCHHGIRGEAADEDLRFAGALCKEYGIRFYEAWENVEELAAKKGMSVEEAGRVFRQDTFLALMKKDGYGKLALAHNADDRAETMLFHLSRGTSLDGLCSMEPVRDYHGGGRLIRPLLWTRKCAIEEWLSNQGISWRVDETNLKDIYTRNSIRHHVLPELTKINDRALEHMGETAEAMSELKSFVQEEEDRLYERMVGQKEDRLELALDEWEQCHTYMKKRILYRCLSEAVGGRKDIGSRHVEDLMNAATGRSGREMISAKSCKVEKVYEKLLFWKDQKDQSNRNLLNQLDVFMEKTPRDGSVILKNEYTKQFDCDKIKEGLCLRFRQPGDYICLKEDGCVKKLNRYFIDEKIPREEREQIPLLADGSHIVWIVGHRISAYYKVTDQTKEILTVTIKNKG